MNVTSISNLRKNTKKYFDQVANDQEIVIVGRANGGSVVLVSLDMYNQLDATEYLNSSKANRLRLLHSIEQARAGKVIPKTPEELEGSV
jgi:antitoxin YefM